MNASPQNSSRDVLSLQITQALHITSAVRVILKHK
nr:MAG TPA: hypothetical protein [Caudoviricetes sp.]